eukprot:gene4674-5283_t
MEKNRPAVNNTKDPGDLTEGLAPDTDEKKEGDEESTLYPECVVCLQNYYHPVQLPCGHIFCFLCVKGVAARSRRCALCRAEVPSDYFDKPIVVEVNKERLTKSAKASSITKKADTGTYKWYYEGRNGWWQYEERASIQLEEAFLNDDQSTELVIAGFIYIVDIKDMVQYRKNYPTRRRRVKRDRAGANKKGIAGLKCTGASQSSSNTEAKHADDVVNKTENGQGSSSRTNIESDDGDFVVEKFENCKV